MLTPLNRKRITMVAGAAMAVLATAHVVTAAFSPSCASQPRAAWLSSYEIGLRLQERGFEMVRLNFSEDRCIDVVARDKSGRFVDLRVNPFNAEIVRYPGQ